MGFLSQSTGYLSGAMEYVSDHGIGWRRKIISLSQESGLEIDFIDPTNKPGGKDMKIGEDKDYQNSLKKTGKFLELRDYVTKYRRYDLRFVDISDFLIVVINPTVPQWGTANECYVAEQQHKPMFFVSEKGGETFPNWLFDLLDFNNQGNPINLFDSIESVVDTLVKMDKGEIPLSRKWVLVRRHLEQSRSSKS